MKATSLKMCAEDETCENWHQVHWANKNTFEIKRKLKM